MRAARRRRGIAAVYTAVVMVPLLGMAALVVDAGFMYAQKSKMQTAADAAALAGAFELPDSASSLVRARHFAALNGYDHTRTGVTVTGNVDPDPLHPNWYVVEIQAPRPLFFARIFGYNTVNIPVSATAEFLSQAPISITGGGTYGAVGPVNLSVFGPQGRYTYGDAYSTKFLDNGDDNPLYNSKGYDFNVFVPGDYAARNGTSIVQVEVFDPDCYNSTAGGGDRNNANGTTRIDEWRDPPAGLPESPSQVQTTTRYRLIDDGGTPNNPSDDTIVATATYGNTSATDMKWVKPSGFQFTPQAGHQYKVNVKTTDGSSENGFSLRAGPPRATGVAFNPNNGTDVTATGNLPMNFNTSGTVTVTLGVIPGGAAGGKMYIDKYDTDVGSVSVSYSCTSLGQTFPGQLSGNGTWKRDTIDIPNSYSTGTWLATYVAGQQDTSVWSMTYERAIDGVPGVLRLVR